MLRLRPYKACDAATVVSWIGDEVSFRLWCADRYASYPITAEDMNRHYASFADTDNFFPMTAFDETGVVGHMIMRFTDADKRVLRFGFIIVDSQKRGRGYGKQMLALAVKYAFEILRVEKITIGVFENNPAARRCYRSLGFRETGQAEICRLLGEDWKCLELEMSKP